jgi:hypothetical protein
VEDRRRRFVDVAVFQEISIFFRYAGRAFRGSPVGWNSACAVSSTLLMRAGLAHPGLVRAQTAAASRCSIPVLQGIFEKTSKFNNKT